MKGTLLPSKPTYELDELIYHSSPYVALTEKNRNFIEGCIKIDSNYDDKQFVALVTALEFCYTEPNLLEVIKEINRINSTRLSDVEMKEIAHRVFVKYPFLIDLKDALDGSQNDIKAIFQKISESIATPNGRKRKNVSFATKFIVYMSEKLSCGANHIYSVYDSKVADCLHEYAEIYDVQKQYKKADFDKYRNSERIWDMYLDYCECLTKLMAAVQKEHGYVITRRELDHLIWYTHK